MKRAALLFLVLAVGLPANGYAKPKITIQLVAESYIGSSGLGQRVFIVLPDGSHATAECWLGLHSSCGVDSFRPEKRVTKSCHSAQEPIATCYVGEVYYATRKGNDLTIYAANGKRVYHVTGSWDSFEDGYSKR
jgi:hypothetical protein